MKQEKGTNTEQEKTKTIKGICNFHSEKEVWSGVIQLNITLASRKQPKECGSMQIK